MANKVKFGLSNCYYAKVTTTGYASPVPLKGAVNLSLDQEGETNKFRADNIDYYVSISNNGYSGTLELALIPDSFLTDIMGEVKDSNNGLQYELSGVDPASFALLFQFEGDENAVRHVLYNCKATRPTLASQTTDATIEPITETLNITAVSKEMTVGGQTKQVVKAKCTTGDSAYTNFFSTVQVPSTST